MAKIRIFDLVFILLSFGIYILLLNIDTQLASCSFFVRHIWMPLILAYYAGRYVSAITGKLKAAGSPGENP